LPTSADPEPDPNLSDKPVPDRDHPILLKNVLMLTFTKHGRECSLTPGQHSREILEELGYTRDKMEQLLADSIVEEAPLGRAKL
jgi:hypothetical protein